MITLSEIKDKAVGSAVKLANQKVVDTINALASKEGNDFADVYLTRMLSYSNVLKGGEYTLTSYLNAVKYLSYKIMGHSNIDSYMYAFPDRYERLLKKYADKGDVKKIRSSYISPFVKEYNSNKLVIELTEQTLVPSDILNAPIFQEAINKLQDLMHTADSEVVQQRSAEALVRELKPRVKKLEIDVTHRTTNEVEEMRQATRRLAEQQRQAIIDKTNTSKDIVESTIIDVVEEEGE